MKKFEQIYTEFHGEEITDVKQLTQATFTGEELKAFCEFYSDQQNKEKDLDLIVANQYVSELRKENKELREKLEISFSHATLTKLNLEAEIQRLATENKELRKSLDLLNKSNEAYSEENERLTKEVDRWKASAIKWQKLYGNEKTNNA